MRISDWSSDVCSSDLDRLEQRLHHFLDRKLDEVGLIEREGDLEARGEGFRAFGDRVLDDLRGRQRVRAGGERHREARARSEEHTSELQSLMRISSAVFCLTKKKINNKINEQHIQSIDISQD